jgi:hypothetical protein
VRTFANEGLRRACSAETAAWDAIIFGRKRCDGRRESLRVWVDAQCALLRDRNVELIRMGGLGAYGRRYAG